MLFNSLEFAVFLPIVFLLYWFFFQKSIGLQNLFLVGVSYVFYGWWDWRFLSLIVLSSMVDFFIGIQLGKEETESKRKILLAISLAVNLGLLGFFKYYNFFIESFVDAFSFFGAKFSPYTLQIILPVGISFYTFQTLSYSIDVYRKKLDPTHDWKSFFAYVSFFPQLVAGPIERATNLLPQFYKKREFDEAKAIDGMRQILWGLFKKIVIADSCAIGVNEIFANSADYSGYMLLLGGVLFAFQIYGDFSGYSDIAIGTARLFGFNLMQNFAFPYLSRDIAEFWRRWHISLSTWFRDYLYIPLGGSRGGNSMRIRNTFAIFLVSGFWHGANWTFIAWGLINALYFLPLMLTNQNRKNLDAAAGKNIFPSVKELGQILTTFFLTVIAWIVFRAESISHASEYIGDMFAGLFNLQTLYYTIGYISSTLGWTSLIFIIVLLVVEWLQRNKQHALEFSGLHLAKATRWGIYTTVVLSIIVFGTFEGGQFIYFQF